MQVRPGMRAIEESLKKMLFQEVKLRNIPNIAVYRDLTIVPSIQPQAHVAVGLSCGPRLALHVNPGGCPKASPEVCSALLPGET